MVRQLLDVQNSIGEKAYERFIGDEVEVLCEGIGRTADGLMTGHSRHGVIVEFQRHKGYDRKVRHGKNTKGSALGSHRRACKRE